MLLIIVRNLMWRDIGSKQYPKLAQVACLFLAILVSSACAERVFNAGKDQYGLHCLSPESVFFQLLARTLALVVDCSCYRLFLTCLT